MREREKQQRSQARLEPGMLGFMVGVLTPKLQKHQKLIQTDGHNTVLNDPGDFPCFHVEEHFRISLQEVGIHSGKNTNRTSGSFLSMSAFLTADKKHRCNINNSSVPFKNTSMHN